MKDFKKYFIIPDEPAIVYKALVNPQILKLWTGAEAEMSTEEGSEFSWYDDNISGVNLEFIDGKYIKQLWFFGDREEDSIVEYKFHEHPKGTSLELRHSNIPDEDFEDIVAGWNDSFFPELIDFFTEEKDN